MEVLRGGPNAVDGESGNCPEDGFGHGGRSDVQNTDCGTGLSDSTSSPLAQHDRDPHLDESGTRHKRQRVRVEPLEDEADLASQSKPAGDDVEMNDSTEAAAEAPDGGENVGLGGYHGSFEGDDFQLARDVLTL